MSKRTKRPSAKGRLEDPKRWLDQLFKQKKLSPRQSEVMHLCFVGKSDAEIRKALDVAQATIRHHVGDSFKKLGISHRREIIGIYAQRLGIVARPSTKKKPSRPSRPVPRPVPRLHNPPPGAKFTGAFGYQWSAKNILLTDEQTKDLFEQVTLFRRHSWDAILRYPPTAAKLLERFPSEEVTAKLTGLVEAGHRNKNRALFVAFFLEHDPYGEVLVRAVGDFQTGQFTARQPRGRLYAKALEDVTEVWSRLNRVRMRLVEANLRLAVSYAKHYACANLEVSDLINQATFGLLKAIDRFDLALGFKFSTYAAHWLRHEVGRARVDTGRTVRLPAHLQAQGNAIFKQWVACEGDLDQIAKVVGQTRKQIERVVRAYQPPLSLEREPVDGEGRPLGNFLPDDAPSAEELLFFEELGPFLQVHLGKLKPRTREILERRFGINGYTAATLTRIGETLGLSRERIRQLERVGLAALRGAMEREDGSRPPHMRCETLKTNPTAAGSR